MIRTSPTLRRDEGAVLIHVAFALIGLFAFSAFAVDYGLLWTSRRMAQNAADAGALAGAVAMAFDSSDRTDTGPIKVIAHGMTQRHRVFGEAPFVNISRDVTFPVCPDGTNNCIRVDVYRDVANANPLPAFFGVLFGRSTQSMKATATAEVATASATDCLKPWAVIDKWAEHWPTTKPWDITATFDKYDKSGDLDPAVTTPDVYIPPYYADPVTDLSFGTGFHPYNVDKTYSPDYGLQMKLKVGDKSDFSYATGWFSALALFDSKGGKDYGVNIKGCVGTIYKIGDVLPIDTEPGEKVGPTRQAVEDDADSLVNQDRDAYWLQSMNGGRGGVAGSRFGNGSPRIVAIPVVNPDIMTEVQKGGRTDVPIVNIIGFFVEGYDNSEKAVVGRLMTMPGLFVAGSPGGPSAGSFLQSIVLVR